LKFVLSNFRVVRLGKTLAQRRMFYRLRSERARFEQEGVEVDAEQLAEALCVKPEEVTEMQQRLEAPEVSIESLVRGDRPSACLSVDGALPDALLARQELQTRVRQAVERLRPTLSEREYQILTERLLCETPKTLRELGTQNGVTRERARQQEARLKEKLRCYLSEQVGGDTEILADAA